MSETATTRGEETRQRVLEIAGLAFLEHGYAGTSLNDLIRATGLTKGGFYFHFASKSELALAALEKLRGDWRAEVLAAIGEHERAVDEIKALVLAVAAHKRSAPATAAMGRLCQELAELPELTQRVRPFEAWLTLTEGLFRKAQAQGDMDPAVDAAAAARYAVGAFVGLDQLADVAGDPGLVQRVAEEHLGFTLRAVGITEHE